MISAMNIQKINLSDENTSLEKYWISLSSSWKVERPFPYCLILPQCNNKKFTMSNLNEAFFFVYFYRIVLLLIGFVVLHSETVIPGCHPSSHIVVDNWTSDLLPSGVIRRGTGEGRWGGVEILGSARITSMYNPTQSVPLLSVDLITVSAAHWISQRLHCPDLRGTL